MSHPTHQKAGASRHLAWSLGVALGILGVVPGAAAAPSGYEKSAAAPTGDQVRDQVRTRIRNLNRWLSDQPFVTVGSGFSSSWLEIDGARLLVHWWNPDLEGGSGRAEIAPVLALDPKLPEFQPGVKTVGSFIACRAEPPISAGAQKCWSVERAHPNAGTYDRTMVTFDADEAIVDLVYRAIEDLIVMLQQRAIALR